MISDLRYAYDNADREVRRQYTHENARTDLYTYDDASRLTAAEHRARLHKDLN